MEGSYFPKENGVAVRPRRFLRAASKREKALADLPCAASHALRTPLTTIYGSRSAILALMIRLNRAQQLKLPQDTCAEAEWLNQMAGNLLLKYSGRIMTYAAIARAIGAMQIAAARRNLQANMANIRKKLGSKPGSNRYILNGLGAKYQMVEDIARAGRP